ncbi:ATPase [Aphelenchoides avenae]|nr:ATPase [Aphelenchus avenae]
MHLGKPVDGYDGWFPDSKFAIKTEDSDKWMATTKKEQRTQHYTMVFNALVMMTLFNEINARKVHGERNVFSGLHRNYIFCAIWISTFVLQAVIVCVGWEYFACHRLNCAQWAVCLVAGAMELAWAQVVASIPSSIIPGSCFSDTEDEVQQPYVPDGTSEGEKLLKEPSAQSSNRDD